MKSKLTEEEVKVKLLTMRKIDSNDCWLFTGYKDYKGYGKICALGEDWLVHRLAARLWHKVFKFKAYYCHICNVKSCFNPEHLYAGDALSNVLDSIRAGTHNWSVKSHCIRGHEFNKENTYIRLNGSKSCKECRKVRRAEKKYGRK